MWKDERIIKFVQGNSGLPYILIAAETEIFKECSWPGDPDLNQFKIFKILRWIENKSISAPVYASWVRFYCQNLSMNVNFRGKQDISPHGGTLKSSRKICGVFCTKIIFLNFILS